MHCRKNQATLSDTERTNLVRALLELKRTGVYDGYVSQHSSSMGNAHRGPAFLPWHREFLRRLELDLQAVDPSVTLPYWDWTVDRLPTAPIFDPAFMGGSGRPSDGRVMTGPFAFDGGSWTLPFGGPDLRRRFGQHALAPDLPPPEEIAPGGPGSVLGVTPYDVSPFDDGAATGGFRNRVEGWFSGPRLHNRVHLWVGGSMLPGTSPNDPLFFLNHCFEDKLWADWQRLNPTQGYVPLGTLGTGHGADDPMEPWATLGQTVTPASMLDHHALGYRYDNEMGCRPTLKFLDDGDVSTLKFREDGDLLTLKFRDDGDIPTLKFRDDGDIPTLKFRDDGDIPTLKFRDDAGPAKFIGDGPETIREEVGRPGPFIDPAPFVLAQPHRSSAWRRSFPEAHRQSLEVLRAEILSLDDAVRELDGLSRTRALTGEELSVLQTSIARLEARAAEWSSLTGEELGGPGG